MNMTQAKYDLRWMPNLLNLCLGIQAHAERLHQAKQGVEGKIKQITTNLEELKTLELQTKQACNEASNSFSEADKAEAEYATFRESIMGRMMDAARAGESIDREEAGKLMELEINRNLKIEKAKNSERNADQLKTRAAEKEKNTLEDLRSCPELQELRYQTNESAQYLKQLCLALEELSLDKDLVNEHHPNNALDKFTKMVETYSLHAITSRAVADDQIAIHSLKDNMMKVPSVETIDSTALFSEICITLAYTLDRGKIDIPAQDAFIGDLTEY